MQTQLLCQEKVGTLSVSLA